MSDPMTNMGADDVLASIRRLVSETYDPQARKPQPVPAQDRFVLSPDLRVVDGDAPYGDAETADDSADAAVEQTAQAHGISDGGSIVDHEDDDAAPLVLDLDSATHIPSVAPEIDSEAEVTADDLGHGAGQDHEAAAGASMDTQVERSQAPEAQDTTRSTTVVEDAVHAAQVLLQDHEDAQDSASDWPSAFHHSPDEVSVEDAAGQSLESRISQLEEAVNTPQDDWAAPTAGADIDDGYEDYDGDAPQVFPRALVNSTARVLNFRTADFDRLADAAEVKAKVMRQEEASQRDAGVTQDSAADADEDDALDFTVRPNAINETQNVDAVEVSFEATAQTASETPEDPMTSTDAMPQTDDMSQTDDFDSADEDLALAGYSDDEVLDEEALRDMIAGVIREELQGALGERITSNVRRLVRREVQRALTLREFD